MKKIFTLIAIISVSFANAQGLDLFSEDFNYTTGQLTAGNNTGANVSGGIWTYVSGNAPYISVTSGGLTYSGYGGASAGTNKIEITSGAGEDVRRSFASQTSGSVYFSFLINVTTTSGLVAAGGDAAGTYLAAFAPTSTSTSYIGRLVIRQGVTAGTFVLGLRNGSASTVNYSTTELPINTTHLVVLKYTFIAGSANDEVALFINPTLTTTEPSPNITNTNWTSSTEPTSIASVIFRQDASGSPTAQLDGVRAGTGWTNAPLPLSLTSFKAALSKGSVGVEWTTTNEVNVKGFSVERSANGQSFSSIGNVDAKAATSNTYSFSDAKPLPGVGYYRLKMMDKDGAFKYSDVVPVTNKSSVVINVFPNPVTTSLTIQHGKGEKGAVVRILDLTGKQVLMVNVAEESIQTTISATKLTPGSYMAVFESNGVKTTKQFVKQ